MKFFRQYNWYAYINKQRSESKMLNTIGKLFGEDCTIIYGDYSEKNQMKNFISTPGISLKRKIADRFKVYNIDEFRTSKLNYKTGSVCCNLHLPDKKNTVRKLHAVLMYKTESGRCGYINRDKNSVKNMKKIVDYFLVHGNRPLEYRRDHKLIDEDNQLKQLNKMNRPLSKAKNVAVHISIKKLFDMLLSDHSYLI